MLSWELYGPGLENLGVDRKPVQISVPDFGDDELLAQIDAVGLCFSDVKLIRAGGAHPRMFGRDLREDPTVPGHEIAMTIVGVNEAEQCLCSKLARRGEQSV